MVRYSPHREPSCPPGDRSQSPPHKDRSNTGEQTPSLSPEPESHENGKRNESVALEKVRCYFGEKHDIKKLITVGSKF